MCVCVAGARGRGQRGVRQPVGCHVASDPPVLTWVANDPDTVDIIRDGCQPFPPEIDRLGLEAQPTTIEAVDLTRAPVLGRLDKLPRTAPLLPRDEI